MGSGRVDSRDLASSPPPGFGPAAARPARAHSAGTTSAARTGMLVDVKIQAGYADRESLRNAGNRNASPAKGRKRKFGVDATKGESAGVNASNTGEHLRSCRKGKGQGKHARLVDKEGATGLGRVQTPTGVYEDECAFCHSFRTSEPLHGPMVLYHNGRIVSADDGHPTNAIYVHHKCMVWAPKVKSNGDTFENVEDEIKRGSGWDCSRCQLKGAALGCYVRGCPNTYHAPCALLIPECRWDEENRYVWCPKHAPPDEMSPPTNESAILSPVLQNQSLAKEISADCQMEDNQIDPLLGNEMSSPIIESGIPSPVLQNHSSNCPAKEISINCRMEDKQINPLLGNEMSSPIVESDIPSPVLQNHSSNRPAKEISADCQMEDKQFNPLITSNSPLPGQVHRQLAKEGISALHRGQNLQIDQPNTSSSSLPQGQCSDKEGISTNYQREEKLVNQSSIPVDQWVLLGVALSASEKDALKEFASLTSSILAEEWDKTVTHVIVGRDAGSACGRSHEVLLAILSGKWVLAAGWVVDCLVKRIPGPKPCLAKLIPSPEISYEVKFFDGLRTSIDGPTKGRARAAEGARKLFSGLRFCLSAFMHPEDRKNIQNLIAAGEGQVLEGMSPDWLRENLNRNPAEVYFIYDGGPPRKPTLDFDLEVQETVEYVESGAQVIRHQQLFDAILSYDRRILEPTSFFTKIRK
ncbi:Protein BREAST CANCER SUSCEPTIBILITY 1-like protein [Hordeum vulgare]|nr:Protein BREAST CANCER SUSCEPTIBILITY 1-like protein [Hordeum vulgare]